MTLLIRRGGRGKQHLALNLAFGNSQFRDTKATELEGRSRVTVTVTVRGTLAPYVTSLSTLIVRYHGDCFNGLTSKMFSTQWRKSSLNPSEH